MPNPRHRTRETLNLPDHQPPEQSREWYVNIPFSDLNKLVNQLETMDGLKNENAQLRREMDGMRNLYNELLVQFGELRRELKGR